MKKNIFETVEELLKSKEKYVSEDGKILKSTVYSDTMTMNEELISLLVSNDDVLKHFFVKVNNNYVFDKQGFTWFLESKEFLPDSYTMYTNKIGLTNGINYLSQSDDVVLDFPYKDCVLEFDSTDENENRREIFYNEIIAHDEISNLFSPKILTNSQIHNKDGVKDIKSYGNESLVIKGNNLIAMYSLLPRFEHQIKLMYWDILYNTQNDIVPYNDSFKHSSWLVMMKNRLEVAKRLLKPDDGVICLQCDDNEQAYLKVLCDEIFGRDSFINCIAVKSSEASGNKMAHVDKRFPKIKDYLLIYKSNVNAVVKIKPVKEEHTDDIEKFADYAKYYSKIIENIDDPANKWIITPIADYIKKNNIDVDVKDNIELTKFKLENASRVVYRTNNKSLEKLSFDTETEEVVSPSGLKYIWWEGKQMLFLADYTSSYLCDMWNDISTINLNKEGGVELKAGKKPEKLISRIIECFAYNENDIVLDAYLGSGTTGAVCMKMNKRFIGIEQLDRHYEKTLTRLKDVIAGDQSGVSKEYNWNGGGSFISTELKANNIKFIEKVIDSTESNIKEISKEIFESDCIISYISKDEIEYCKDLFEKLDFEDKKKLLIRFIDKNRLYVNYSDINDGDYIINNNEKEFNKSFYEGE